MASPESQSSEHSVLQAVSGGSNHVDLFEPVVLEIGNHIYKTTLSTLKKIPNTYFSAMLSGQYPIVKQIDGSLFIDRDGKHFGSILSFMRSGYLAKPRDRVERKELLLEAEYYCLKDAIQDAWVRSLFSRLVGISRFLCWLFTDRVRFRLPLCS